MTQPHPAHVRGFSLLEAMIAMLVLSIGLIGVAGIMLAAQKTSGQAYWQTVANREAGNMLERIRANRAGAMQGDYQGSSAAPPAAVSCTVQAPCSPAATAANDMASWFADLGTVLPPPPPSGAPAAVIRTQIVNGTAWVSITETWSLPTSAGNPTASATTQSLTITAGIQP